MGEAHHGILFRHQHGILCEVRHADRSRSLEKFVFEQVRESGFPGNLVHGARHVEQSAADCRRLVVWVEQDGETVVEDFPVNRKIDSEKRRLHGQENPEENLSHGTSKSFIQRASCSVWSGIPR